MITVQQASEIINNVAFQPGAARVHLNDATGRVLAETISADRDLPPFHRATRDGIAIRYDDYAKGKKEFVVNGVQAAGQPQQKLSEGCFEIMTGAVLPENSDTVVRYEDLTIDNNKATINVDIERNQSVHARGIDAKKGETLLKPGTLITSAEIALLASVGKYEVGVYDVKPIAIVSTGDELVPVEQTPLPYQVRRSNGIALASALKELRIQSSITHLPDDEILLETELEKIIAKHDVIILSGGVSKGKFDFIPVVLEKLGIKKVFHQVKQRPGKPFWFGRNETKTVFALPGNPVSTLLCYHKYIKPWIRSGLGMVPHNIKVILNEDYSFKPDLTYFLQVKLNDTDGINLATPVAGEGSGDFANLRHIDGFIELPSERSDFKKGDAFSFVSIRR